MAKKRNHALPPAPEEAPPVVATAPAIEEAPAGPGCYQVELAHSLTWTTEADSPEHAWELYRGRMGLLGTEHTPRITEVTGDGD